MRAIVVKELRENLRWLPIGILLVGVFVWLVTPTQIYDLSRNDISRSLMLSAGIGAAIFAIALATLQSVFDFSDKQRGYLFHRSLSATGVLYGKVIAGAVLYCMACAVPLFLIAMWFQWKGLELLPVRPAQVLPAVAMCVACFLLHPATLISVDRHARWFGTKLLPLFAVAGVLFLLQPFELTNRSPWWWPVVASFSLFFVLVLVAVQPAHWMRKGLLALGAFAIIMTCSVFVIIFLESIRGSQTQFTYNNIGIDAAGDLWHLRLKQEYVAEKNSYVTNPLSGDRIEANKKPDLDATLPDDFATQEFPRFLSSISYVPQTDSGLAIKYVGDTNGKLMFFDSRGVVLVYDRSLPPLLSGVVSRTGLHSIGQTSGQRFSLNAVQFGQQFSQALTSSSFESLWADREGVYQFDPRQGTMTTLLELPVEAGTTIASPGHKAPQLLLQSEGKYHLFALLDQTESEDWFDPLPELEGFVTLANTRPLPPLKLRATATMPALPKEFAMAASITITAKGKLVTTARGVSAYATFDPRGDRQWQVTEYISPDTVPAGVESVMVASMIPYGLAAFGYGLFALSNLAAGRAAVSGAYLTNLETIVVIVAVTTLVAIVLGAATFLLCRRRGLSRQASLWWIVVSLFLGLATPLAIVAIYPKLVREPCSGCQRQRRVDHDKCSHCGAEWSPPPTAGIELLEGQALVAHAHPHPV